MFQLSVPMNWREYALIDCGDYEKLERYGKYFIRRPEPQAVWPKSLSNKEWERLTHAFFKKEKYKNSPDGNDKGEWIVCREMPSQWFVSYRYGQMNLRFRLGLTSFKHLGLFPEQASNWDYIYDTLRSFREADASVLNLFAYTGGASLAACAAGGKVWHVDSVRQVITWAKENMEASLLQDVRWVVEDVLKYLRREVKRGKQYAAIIMDPPAYGRGPNGEKWILEENIAELMDLSRQLLRPKDAFLLINLYSMGFSSLIAYNLINKYFPEAVDTTYGELIIPDNGGNRLPLSVYARMRR